MRSHSLPRLLLAIFAASAVAPYVSTYIFCLDAIWAPPLSPTWPRLNIFAVLWGAVWFSWLGLGLGFLGALIVLAPALAAAEYVVPFGGRMVRFSFAGLAAAFLACVGSVWVVADHPRGTLSLLTGAWAVSGLMVKPPHTASAAAAPYIGGLAAGTIAGLITSPRSPWKPRVAAATE